MHFTAQEIRDLKDVFDFFDHKHRGFDIIISIYKYYSFIFFSRRLEILNQKRLSMQ